jgi:hypothetical protein
LGNLAAFGRRLHELSHQEKAAGLKHGNIRRRQGQYLTRARVEYYPGYYADVFDPDGYSFEIAHKS